MGRFGRSKVSAGLDIGSGFVKLVVIDHSKPEPEIVRIMTSPLVPDAIVEGEIMDPVLVAETIRAIVEGAGLKKRQVVAAVGGHDVIVKKIQMDRMSDADAKDVIRWEAEQHVPFDMESVQLDYQILDPEGTGPQMQVLLVAAKRELIENRLGLLADAGLEPRVLDVEAFALHNAFERNYPEPIRGLAALVNIGHDTTNIDLLADRVPVLVRDVPFGSRRLREALQRERGLSADQAEAVLQGKGEATDLDGFLRDRVDELAIGIERAVAFVLSQNGKETRSLAKVYVSGGGARVPGLVAALGARLRVPAEAASPVQRIAVRPDVIESVALDEFAPMLMLPIGLALRDGG